jgi:hypothetical protein
MKKYIIVAFLGVAAIAQQSTPKWIYGYSGGKALWLSVGPTLTVSAGGQLDVIQSTAPTPKAELTDVLLIHDATAGGWRLPAGVVKFKLHVNGIRYRQTGNWTVTNGVVTPLSDNMPIGSEVTIDYIP